MPSAEPKPLMHDPEESESSRVAMKPMNKAGRPAAELAEPRPATKGNADQQSTHRTQSRARVTHALDGAIVIPRFSPRARRNLKLAFFSFVIGLLTVLIYLYLTSLVVLPNKVEPITNTSFDECAVTVRNVLQPAHADLDLLHKVDQLCYDHVYWRRLLDDFLIRRSKLIQQNSEDIILLCMVVAITLSGVAFAGLQLLGSYRLASAGKGEFAEQAGEVSFKARGELSVKSSVTGLLILTFSFAFFLVYVVWVYPVQQIKIDPNSSTRPAPQGQDSSTVNGAGNVPKPNIGIGGLGEPDTVSKVPK